MAGIIKEEEEKEEKRTSIDINHKVHTLQTLLLLLLLLLPRYTIKHAWLKRLRTLRSKKKKKES